MWLHSRHQSQSEWGSLPSANQRRERVWGREARAAVRLKSREQRAAGRLEEAAPSRSLEMVLGAAGWWCLLLWLPACVAAHGEWQRAGLYCGTGHAACARLGPGATGHLGDPESSGQGRSGDGRLE